MAAASLSSSSSRRNFPNCPQSCRECTIVAQILTCPWALLRVTHQATALLSDRLVSKYRCLLLQAFVCSNVKIMSNRGKCYVSRSHYIIWQRIHYIEYETLVPSALIILVGNLYVSFGSRHLRVGFHYILYCVPCSKC